MANDIPQNLKYTRIGVEGVVEVNAHLVGSNLIDSLRRTFTIDSQMEQGDNFMDRSLNLLENHLQLMLLREQNTIRERYIEARDLKHELHSDDYNGSPFQRFFKAREYKRLSKKAYKVIKIASDRVREDPLFMETTQPHGGQSGSGPGIASKPRNPFTDSHAVISTLTDVDVNNLDQVEMSTYQEEATNGAAVVLDFVARDKSVQHVVATFPTEASSGDRTDREAPAAISLHRDDGSSPRFIAASPPDVSDQRADGQAETRTLDSFDSSDVATSGGNRPHPVMRASVPPVDGDPYTRSFAPRRPL
ncbi:hypothetical protein F5888DRAFT_1718773 [Russula emetica]|nr:hypothetical protein F5888DRAFT_1718773 [Russula emetica]